MSDADACDASPIPRLCTVQRGVLSLKHCFKHYQREIGAQQTEEVYKLSS
jgi:hypothetical protein